MATLTSKRATSTLNPGAQEWFPPGYQHGAKAGPNKDAAPAACTEAALDLAELPREILSCVMASLGSAEDLCRCLMVNQQLLTAVQSARMSLNLTDRPRQLLSFPARPGCLDQLVHSLTRYMPAMRSCNLSTLPLEHTHVRQLAQGLLLLEHLDLSRCQKLQDKDVCCLLQHLATKRLASLNLQRCFQLTAASLTDILGYACGGAGASRSSSGGGGSALQCIAVSHLNLAGWPAVDGSSTSTRSNSDSSSGAAVATASSSGSFGEGMGPAAAASSQWAQRAAELLQRLPRQLGIPTAAAAPVTGLRVVVLSNCSTLTAQGLLSLAMACPNLEYIFLGGSSIQTPRLAMPAGPGAAASVYVPRLAAAAAARGDEAAGPPGGAGGAAIDLPVALQQLAQRLDLPDTLPWEVLSRCCEPPSIRTHGGCRDDSCSCFGSSSTAGHGSSTTSSCCCGRESVGGSGGRGNRNHCDGDRDVGLQDQRACKRLCRNEPSPAAATAARSQALALAYMAGLLPRLRAVEVTFMAPGVAGWLRVCLQRMQQQQLLAPGGGSSAGASSGAQWAGGVCPKVWQFSCVNTVTEALQVLQEARWDYSRVRSSSSSSSGGLSTGGSGCPVSLVSPAAPPVSGLTGGCKASKPAAPAFAPPVPAPMQQADGGPCDPACLEMAVRCAANCSSRGRSAPLHTAADSGCACHVRVLLAAGASVTARDGSGASAVFVAAEAGQAAAAAALLVAGADSLVANTAGETPLYIAALRGHVRVVELLLQHLSAADVDWTQRGLYLSGDSWTPLMAAAVGNRVNVAVCLLRAAAMLCGSSHTTHRKAAAQNSAAASASSNQCGTSIAGGGIASSSSSSSTAVVRLLAAENRYGQTVLHIAARKGCLELLRLLLLYGAGRLVGRAVDAAGDTPLDIARRHGHEVAVRELLQQC